MNAEHRRLDETRAGTRPWRRWGPYLSERAWGTVREDYSEDGEAWAFLTHDMARSKAYRWGEDGLAGFCDQYQLLCFSVVLWNGRDSMLKERLFGVTPLEGNHGEDVKEYYHYVDATPTHSYLRYLYRYPQAAFPYRRLVEENQAREGEGAEFELLDTGLFDEDRYFDVVVEYAKADAEDICIRIEVFNRGPDAAALHVLPTLWFRNIWSWGDTRRREPRIEVADEGAEGIVLIADDSHADGLVNLPFAYQLGPRRLYACAGGTPLFTDNESHCERLYGVPHPEGRRFYKDAFDRRIVGGEDCCNPARVGTRACLHYRQEIAAHGSRVWHLRLTPHARSDALGDVDAVVRERLRDADAFYASVHPPRASADERLIQRQALAGLIWGKQNYIFDTQLWLQGDSLRHPPPPEHSRIRNRHWRHLKSMRVLSMPDKWEYPWFAAWDLAFHCVPMTLIDAEFAKEQLWLLLFEQFQHPNGQIPAYEWEFSEMNPPVHAWAVWRVYRMDRDRSGTADRAFLERCFHKLLINFAWWVNKIDRDGNNVFEGGFLGLDNIAVFDRSKKVPGGAALEQSDGTGWMGLFCLNMMRIALELARENPVYEGLATKFFQHFVYVAAAMKHMGGRDYSLWDEDDGFFYDLLRYPDGTVHHLRVRSLVGLIPLFAVESLRNDDVEPFPEFRRSFLWFLKHRQDVVPHCCNRLDRNGQDTRVLTVANPDQLRRVLKRVWDTGEFLSPFGLRSLSRAHAADPFTFDGRSVGYEPAEAVTKIKGGNSNWRGPVWFPIGFLMIESLRELHDAYGALLDIEDADGRTVTAGDMARGLADRMIAIFCRDARGRRPVFGDRARFQRDAHWRDHLLFYEYFHGDNGSGLGASHQTGWTALVASLIDEWRR